MKQKKTENFSFLSLFSFLFCSFHILLLSVNLSLFSLPPFKSRKSKNLVFVCVGCARRKRTKNKNIFFNRKPSYKSLSLSLFLFSLSLSPHPFTQRASRPPPRRHPFPGLSLPPRARASVILSCGGPRGARPPRRRRSPSSSGVSKRSMAEEAGRWREKFHSPSSSASPLLALLLCCCCSLASFSSPASAGPRQPEPPAAARSPRMRPADPAEEASPRRPPRAPRALRGASLLRASGCPAALHPPQRGLLGREKNKPAAVEA